VTTHSPLAALGYSSLIAAEYACRFDDGDSFKAATKAALGIDPAEVSTLMGVSLPWEVRAKIEIYIAAPDFSTLYRPNIEAICSALAYHNFTVHRPVQDNGEVPNSASPEEKSRIGHLDADLIRRCRVLLAVLEYDDPGTYVEIGMAATLNIPVVVYDPHSLAQNLMVTSFATLVSADRDVVLGEIYRIAESLR
jgi:nucleoside 2-deoxyribosyltransferase